VTSAGETISRLERNGREFWNLYSGKREVLGMVLLFHDPFDQFAWCQEWRFALCDLLYWQGVSVPDFKTLLTGPDTSSFAYQYLWDMSADREACRYALRILDRYREWLRIAGEDY
jgi:hypothetical protein